MNIIIYGSQYGSAEKYAKELAKTTKFDCKSYEDIKHLDDYDTIIYIGALYAGGALGMKKTFKNSINIKNKKIIIVTVGLADTTDKAYTDVIKSGLKKQLSDEIYNAAHIFHLRGEIDYSKLNFKHKTMMHLLYKQVVKLPDEKKTADDIAMIETYNKHVSFIDYNSLKPIIQCI